MTRHNNDMDIQSIDDIRHLFRLYGDENYGETMTQLAHALQAATFAKQAKSSDHLICAALLHDIGHFIMGNTRSLATSDMKHEAIGASSLKTFLPESVYLPIALHVDAKRYLCTINPDYQSDLSAESNRSLALQGGKMSPKEVTTFRERSSANDALALRHFDDCAKLEQMETPDLDYFLHHYVEPLMAS